VPSRKPEDLHPLVYPLYRSARARWTKGLRPNEDVLLICTFRTFEEQAAEYAKGRTKPGRIVTWAGPGESNHNFMVDRKPASLAAMPLNLLSRTSSRTFSWGSSPSRAVMSSTASSLRRRLRGGAGSSTLPPPTVVAGE